MKIICKNKEEFFEILHASKYIFDYHIKDESCLAMNLKLVANFTNVHRVLYLKDEEFSQWEKDVIKVPKHKLKNLVKEYLDNEQRKLMDGFKD